MGGTQGKAAAPVPVAPVPSKYSVQKDSLDGGTFGQVYLAVRAAATSVCGAAWACWLGHVSVCVCVQRDTEGRQCVVKRIPWMQMNEQEYHHSTAMTEVVAMRRITHAQQRNADRSHVRFLCPCAPRQGHVLCDRLCTLSRSCAV